MLIYVSGAMTGLKDYNKTEFDKAQKELTDKGFAVVNPHDLSEGVFDTFHEKGEEPTRSDFMRVDIRMLSVCNAVYMIPGWEGSWGANWEKKIAEEVFNMPIYYNIDDIPR